MQDFHQKPVPADIQEQVTALGSAMGTVPSGSTLQGQVDTLKDNLVTLDYQIKKYDSSSVTVSANGSDTTQISVPAITGYTAYLASCYCDNDLFSVSPRWFNSIILNVTLHNFHSASQTTTAHAIIFYKKNLA